MKPLMLELENFGPYVKEKIDFTRFNDAPLFLITGKTGSGKSTLFDAMCYALYGQTSGNQRTGEQMRANFATKAEETKVCFTFEHQQKRYEITRNPTYTYLRKTKIVTKQSSVTLKYKSDDETLVVLNKITEVKNFVTNLLGLNAEQFIQTILLPQGKFQTFLLADSNKKEDNIG